MTNLFGSLDIEIWDLFGIWRLEFDISEYIDARDGSLKFAFLMGINTVEFHIRKDYNPSILNGERWTFKPISLQSFNPERGTVNL